MDLLVGDVLAVLGDAGAERAHVVGHDWGAGVAWATALMAAERVERLVTMSVGHPATFFADGFEQYEKSWYMLLFQFSGIAEEWLSGTTGPTSGRGATTPISMRRSPNWRQTAH